MIKQNSFYINKLNSIVIFGYHNFIDQIININKKKRLKTLIICTNKQAINYKNKKNVLIIKSLNKKIKDNIKLFSNNKTTLYISLGSRILFKKEDIKKNFVSNLVNFHSSRLPFDAGGGGYSWRILKNDRIDNQLVHLVSDNKIDSGYILDNKVSVFPKELQTPEELQNYSNKKFLNFYENFLDKLQNNKRFLLKKNIKYLGTYYPRINSKKDSYIDWSYSSNELIRFINAFESPYTGSTTFIKIKNKKIKVSLKKVQLHNGENNHSFISGLVVKKFKNFIIIATKDSQNLIVEEVLYKNTNIIDKIREGSRFYTDTILLEKARNIRTFYKS